MRNEGLAMRKVDYTPAEEAVQPDPSKKLVAANDNEPKEQPITTVEIGESHDNVVVLDAAKIAEVKERLGLVEDTKKKEEVPVIIPEEVPTPVIESVETEHATQEHVHSAEVEAPAGSGSGTGTGGERNAGGGHGAGTRETVQAAEVKKKTVWGKIFSKIFRGGLKALKGLAVVFGGLFALSLNGVRIGSEKIIDASGEGGKHAPKPKAGGGHGGGGGHAKH